MLGLRLKMMEGILTAAKPSLVEETICHLLNEETSKDDPAFQLSQFTNNLKSDILFQLMSKQSHQEFKNLKEALHVIQLYTTNIPDEDTSLLWKQEP